jgi:glycosyltransferase involved in cell wall biosynthesis
VILADSGSTDRTLEIASALPVRIVQLANTAERCCGAGAQLAFQHARGDYFYLLDGDMVLDPDFLSAGIAHLEANPEFAAVGGIVNEMNTEGHDFQIRANTVRTAATGGRASSTGSTAAASIASTPFRQVGYFADRNLHAFEEFDLGARLQSRGWKLARIDKPAVDHYGHQMDGYKLLWRRMKSATRAPGEVLRGAVGQKHLAIVLRRLGHVRNGLAIMAWWACLLASLAAPVLLAGRLGLFLALLLAPLAVLVLRRGSFKLGLYSLVAWNVSALSLVTGFFRRRTPPTTALSSVTLAEPR